MNVMHNLTERLLRLLSLDYRILVLLMTALVTMPGCVEALGFGTLSLTSHLNQTLKADIPMLLSDSDDLKKVSVALATPSEYRQLGLQWHSDLARVQVLIQNRYSNHPMVQLRSAGLINAPMLSIVLKAKKSNRGTYFKHYQLMLDPVSRPQQVLLPSLSSLTFEPLTIDNAAPSLAKGDIWSRTWRYGPVQAGDNLSEIAYRLRVDKRFSNKQVMLSLYENNAAAFVDGNINHLIKGAWLTVPRADEVEKNADNTAILKLSKLLRRENPTTRSLKKAKRRTDLIAVNAAPVSSVAIDSGGQVLRYSGEIGLNDIGAVEALQAVSALKQGVAEQFETIHKGLMAGKLQMTTLDETMSTLTLSMQGVKSDIQRLQKDIEIIKDRTESLSPDESDVWMNWQFILIVILFIALISVLLLLIMQRRKSMEKPRLSEQPELDSEPDHLLLNDHRADDVEMMESQLDSKRHDHLRGEPQTPPLDTVKKESEDLMSLTLMEDFASAGMLDKGVAPPPLADEAVQLLNQIEEKLGLCEFEEAESLLNKIDDTHAGSLKATALRAQLYHETDRFDERDMLINSISESSNEQHWERFCYYLPSHVWNACFGGSASSDDSQRPV